MANNHELEVLVRAQIQHEKNGSNGTGNSTIDSITACTGTRPIIVDFMLKIWNEDTARALGYVTVFIDENVDFYLLTGLVSLALDNNEYLSYNHPENAGFDIMKFKNENLHMKVHYSDTDLPDRTVRTNDEMRTAVALLRDRGWSGFDRFQIWFTEEHIPASWWTNFTNYFRRHKKGNHWVQAKAKVDKRRGLGGSSAKGKSPAT